MDPDALRHALRPGDVVWGDGVAVRVARVGLGSAVGVPLRDEPQVVAVAYEDVEGVVVREPERLGCLTSIQTRDRWLSARKFSPAAWSDEILFVH